MIVGGLKEPHAKRITLWPPITIWKIWFGWSHVRCSQKLDSWKCGINSGLVTIWEIQHTFRFKSSLGKQIRYICPAVLTAGYTQVVLYLKAYSFQGTVRQVPFHLYCLDLLESSTCVLHELHIDGHKLGDEGLEVVDGLIALLQPVLVECSDLAKFSLQLTITHLVNDD